MQSLASALLLASLAAAPAVAAESAKPPKLPTAAEVQARYVRASGGEKAIRSHRAMRVLGRLEMPAQEMAGTMELWGAAPNRMWIRLRIDGLGESLSGYDGEVGWSLDPTMGPMLIDGRMLQQLRQQADYYAILHPERHEKSATVEGRVEFGGRECYQRRVTTKWDETYDEFYEVDSGMLAGVRRKQGTAMGEVEVESEFSAYRKFGGIQMATRLVQRVLGMEQIMTIESVTYDDLPADAFALPDEIAALVRARTD